MNRTALQEFADLLRDERRGSAFRRDAGHKCDRCGIDPADVREQGFSDMAYIAQRWVDRQLSAPEWPSAEYGRDLRQAVASATSPSTESADYWVGYLGEALHLLLNDLGVPPLIGADEAEDALVDGAA